MFNSQLPTHVRTASGAEERHPWDGLLILAFPWQGHLCKLAWGLTVQVAVFVCRNQALVMDGVSIVPSVVPSMHRCGRHQEERPTVSGMQSSIRKPAELLSAGALNPAVPLVCGGWISGHAPV